MSEESLSGMADGPAQSALRDALAKGDAILAASPTLLRHLMAGRDRTLFGDEVIARGRGMLGHVARQMLAPLMSAGEIAQPDAEAMERELADALTQDADFLGHVHALAIEAMLADRLQRDAAIDAVLSPLMQELAATPDPQLAERAMQALAAQARFVQQVRQMELPLGELPGDLFHRALQILEQHLAGAGAPTHAEEGLRDAYDEGQGRLAQLAQLVMSLGSDVERALAVEHAGLAIFATALGMATGQGRGLAILSCCEQHLPRLALSLRAAGLDPDTAERQLALFDPSHSLSESLDLIQPAQAGIMLDASRREAWG